MNSHRENLKNNDVLFFFTCKHIYLTRIFFNVNYNLYNVKKNLNGQYRHLFVRIQLEYIK